MDLKTLIETRDLRLNIFRRSLQEGWSTRVSAARAGLKQRDFTYLRANDQEFRALCEMYNKVQINKKKFDTGS